MGYGSNSLLYLQILGLQGELGGFLSQLAGEGAVVGLQLDALLLKAVQFAFQDLEGKARRVMRLRLKSPCHSLNTIKPILGW